MVYPNITSPLSGTGGDIVYIYLKVNVKDDPRDGKPFDSAQGHCKAQGANLAFINNATENDLLWRNYLL